MTALELSRRADEAYGDRHITPAMYRALEPGAEAAYELASAEAGLRYWRRQVRVYVKAWRTLGSEPDPILELSWWRALYHDRLAECWRRYRHCQAEIRRVKDQSSWREPR